MSFKIGVVSVFPELVEDFFSKGLVGQAKQKEILEIQSCNPREFTTDVHHTVDDRPFGGGDGMIMLAEPLALACKKLKALAPSAQVIYLSPQGRQLTDSVLREIVQDQKGVILVCGRYGGVDERFLAEHVDQEISVGDYVLNGGEAAAIVFIEALARLLPGVLGNKTSGERDSFSDGLLEAPQFTRPQVYEDMPVPQVLTSGHHGKIEGWRRSLSVLRTHFRRPELLQNQIKRGQVSLDDWQAASQLYLSMDLNQRKTCGLPVDGQLDPAHQAW